MQRTMASITVFKAQMKIFEKKCMSDKNYEIAEVSTKGLLNHTDQVFAKQKPKTDSEKLVAGMEA